MAGWIIVSNPLVTPCNRITHPCLWPRNLAVAPTGVSGDHIPASLTCVWPYDLI